MLTPQDIKYIVDWAKSGNSWQRMPSLSLSVLQQMCGRSPESSDFYRLNSAGLTIAALAKALEQANAAADELRYSSDETFGPRDELLSAFEAMGRTKKELLG